MTELHLNITAISGIGNSNGGDTDILRPCSQKPVDTCNKSSDKMTALRHITPSESTLLSAICGNFNKTLESGCIDKRAGEELMYGIFRTCPSDRQKCWRCRRHSPKSEWLHHFTTLAETFRENRNV